MLNCPWGEISIPRKLDFSEISPPQSLLPSNFVNLKFNISLNLLIIVFIMIVFCCMWQKNKSKIATQKYKINEIAKLKFSPLSRVVK